MELPLSLQRFVPFLALALVVLVLPAHGQVTTPCTANMISSFSPCLNFLTNSTGNGTSPTADCCNALKSLTSGGMDCACLIVTGNVPLQIPINRSLAISLPRACNMPGVPVQCKATGAPIPAPGPASFGPSLSPGASPAAAPTAVVPEPTPSAEGPESDTTQTLAPPTPDVDSEAPTVNPGSRPVLTPPSAAIHSHAFSPSLLLLALGFVLLKNY